VLLTYLKAPAPVELEDFEAQVFRDVPAEQKVTLLRAVERCLLAREYLGPNDDRTLSVNVGIARVIQACASPDQSWFVQHRRRGEAEIAHCFHRRAELFVVLTRPLEGMHHLVAFVDDKLIQQTVLDLVAAREATAVVCDPGTVPMTVLGLLTKDSQQFDPSTAAAQLVEAGLTPGTAEGFTRSLEALQSITILTRVTHTTGMKPTPEVNVTVVADGSTLWLLAQESAERLSVRSVGAEDLAAIVHHLIGELRSSSPGN
jgi:hypothetical protein